MRVIHLRLLFQAPSIKKVHESLHVVSTLEMQLTENITFVITFSDMLYYFVILQFMVKKNIQMHFNTEKI